MRGLLVRVGIDQTYGGWNAPVDPDTLEFSYVPIPDGPQHRELATPYTRVLDAGVRSWAWRNRSYRIRSDLLEAWNHVSCRDGFIQRSAVPPAFRDPARFLSWFEKQGPELVAANNL